MTTRAARTAGLLVVAVLAVACSGGQVPSGASPNPMPSRSFERPPLPPQTGGATPSEPVPGAVPDRIMDLVRADLSSRLGRAVANPRIVVAEAVTWSDGSLGCPRPGQLYTQALVPGYRIVVEVDGTTYDYRAGRDGPVRLCEPFQPGIVQP